MNAPPAIRDRVEAAPVSRSGHLRTRSAALRVRLAREARGLEAPFATADRVNDGVRWLRRHPEVLIGVALVLVVLQPRTAWRWAMRGWGAWTLGRRALQQFDGRATVPPARTRSQVGRVPAVRRATDARR